MSPIGRIFIVLNLVLAAGFLFWASTSLATAENWKKKYNALDTEKSEMISGLEAEVSDLKVAKETHADAERQRREERDRLEADVARIEGDLSGLTREKERLLGDITSIRGTLGDVNDTIAQVTAAKDRAFEQMQEMERERDAATDAAQAAETAKRNALDAQRRAETMVADLQTERESLRSQISMFDTRMATLAAVYGIDISGLEQPDIDASVLDVRMDLAPGLVMLNVGADQAVKRGYVFDVYSGRQYKGRVRVENVEGTMCSALVVGTADGATIQRGDRASTHI